MSVAVVLLVFVLLCGTNAASQSDLYDTNLLEQIDSVKPIADLVHYSVSIFDNIAFVFGGLSRDNDRFYNTLWTIELSGPQLVWKADETFNPVPGRAGHTASVVESSEQLYIFGGANHDGFLNDLWIYDLPNRAWETCVTSSTAPSGRAGHSAFVTDNGHIFVFAGASQEGLRNDLWQFVPATRSWSQAFQGTTVPSPRYFADMMPSNNSLYVFDLRGGTLTPGKLPAKFWNPERRFVAIEHPPITSGETWTFDTNSKMWTYQECMLSGLAPSTPAADCKTDFRLECANDCSGNGVCVADGDCACRGEWEGEDCSENGCNYVEHRGYNVELMDSILIAESLTKLKTVLMQLKAKLDYTQKNLPAFEDLTSCTVYEPLSPVIVQSAGTLGAQFHESANNDVIDVLDEFGQCLAATTKANLDVTPWIEQIDPFNFYFGTDALTNPHINFKQWMSLFAPSLN